MVNSYYANGKLLLSGEYLVLHGANALVLPLKIGQHMNVTPTGYSKEAIISWQANALHESWFSAEINIRNWTINTTTNRETANRLLRLLQEAGKLNHLLFNPGTGYDILTETGFNMDWGFGSSSALTANIAQWAMIDPFELHFRTSGGSGADIAAAISPGPVLYRLVDNKPVYSRVNFKPSFFGHLWLVYLGQKQSTSHSVHDFRIKVKVLPKYIADMDRLTIEMVNAVSLKSFMILIREHEDLLSRLMDIIPVRESQFGNFPGEIKSLGAWGGDFVLAASEENDNVVRDYFNRKEMTPVFSFDKIVL